MHHVSDKGAAPTLTPEALLRTIKEMREELGRAPTSKELAKRLDRRIETIYDKIRILLQAEWIMQEGEGWRVVIMETPENPVTPATWTPEQVAEHLAHPAPCTAGTLPTYTVPQPPKAIIRNVPDLPAETHQPPARVEVQTKVAKVIQWPADADLLLEIADMKANGVANPAKVLAERYKCTEAAVRLHMAEARKRLEGLNQTLGQQTEPTEQPPAQADTPKEPPLLVLIPDGGKASGIQKDWIDPEPAPAPGDLWFEHSGTYYKAWVCREKLTLGERTVCVMTQFTGKHLVIRGEAIA